MDTEAVNTLVTSFLKQDPVGAANRLKLAAAQANIAGDSNVKSSILKQVSEWIDSCIRLDSTLHSLYRVTEYSGKATIHSALRTFRETQSFLSPTRPTPDSRFD